ncbi:MAG TPA: hypothetical protein VFX02_08005 [Gammaproteobacteria bacterium]|nr:hypothetical protein [Gammaproteobacteria bacterium]
MLLAYLTSGRKSMAESKVAYWCDFLRFPDEYCYYCEPVHLRADIADALVFDRSHFVLTRTEAQLLVDAINEYLPDDLWIEKAPSNRWYLLSGKEISGSVPALQEMQGRPVGGILTGKASAAEWRLLMNELQILLHQHPVNIRREQRGELPVNGVWIYTGRAVQILGYTVGHVVTHSLDMRTACRALNIVSVQRLDEAVFSGDDHDILVFDESLDSKINDRKSGLELMEMNWFEQAYAWLQKGLVKEIVIDPADGRRFVIRRNSLKRFWKRRHPLNFYEQKA